MRGAGTQEGKKEVRYEGENRGLTKGKKKVSIIKEYKSRGGEGSGDIGEIKKEEYKGKDRGKLRGYIRMQGQ